MCCVVTIFILVHSFFKLLFQQVQEAQTKGPYNLVGVSWGGVLTLELAKILEEQGAKTRVVLLDGALETTRSMVELLNHGARLDANLICRLLQINNTKVNANLHIICHRVFNYGCLSISGQFERCVINYNSYEKLVFYKTVTEFNFFHMWSWRFTHKIKFQGKRRMG